MKNLQSNEEFKKLVTALSELILTYESHIWGLALSDELAEEEVVLHINLALWPPDPLWETISGEYWKALWGGLEIKIHGDESPPHSSQEGLERCFAEAL